MKSFLSRYLKFIIGSLVALAVLISVGIISIGNQLEVEAMQSTYTLTNFDYIVTSPSDEQVEEFEKSNAVESVFPFYNVSAKLTGERTTTITILGADSFDGYQTSFFTEANCVEGGASEDGIMLDQTAADALGISVGDTVYFTYAGQTISVKVSGIYLACTYNLYNDGIALMVFGDNIKSAAKSLNYYSGAFIKAKDEAACATLLTGYIPWARFYYTYGTKDEYVEKYIDDQPVVMTKDEWTAYLEAEWEEYYASWAAKTYTETTSKSEQYGLIAGKIDNLQESTDSLVNIVSLAVAAALCLLMIIFIATNKGNDSQLIQDGASFAKMFSGYVLLSALCVILTATVTFAALWFYAGTSFFASACTSIIMKFALLPLIALPVAIITSAIYLKIIY